MAGDQAAGDRPVTPLGPCASTRGRALKSALSVVGFWAWDARSVGLASERASKQASRFSFLVHQLLFCLCEIPDIPPLTCPQAGSSMLFASCR